MPWNQKTLIGYFGELCVSIAAAGSYFIVTGVLLTLFISMSWHHHAFYQIFEHSVFELNHLDKRRNEHIQIHLCQLIRYHITIKKWEKLDLILIVIDYWINQYFISWFLKTADVYSPFCLILLISSMMMLSCSAFQMDLVSLFWIFLSHIMNWNIFQA